MSEASVRDFQPKLVVNNERPDRLEGTTPNPTPLKGGDDGGTFDGMEARVAVLENEVKHIREDIGLIRTSMTKATDDIGTIKIDLATLRQTVGTLPTKDWAVGALLKLAAVIVALSVISTTATIFVPKILQSAATPPVSVIPQNPK